jgi:gliding motility-associated-like protein
LSATNIAQPTANAAGTYTVTVTNTSNGCTATDQVVVTQDIAAPTADAGLDATLTCATTSTTIGTAAVAGTNYAWSPATGLSATNIAQPTASAAGTYTVTATNTTNGCTVSDQVIISQNITPPTANAGIAATLTCTTTSSTIGTAAIVGNTYAWSPATGLSATNIAQPTASAAGTYIVTVTNTTNGCSATAQVVISQNTTPPTANAGLNVTLTCSNTSATVGTAAVTGNTYAWSPAAGLSATNIAQPTANAAGTYTVTVTNTANGCTNTDNVLVINNIQTISASIATNDPSCMNYTDGSATASPSNGTAPYSYSWSVTGAGNNATISNLAAQNVSVTVTDANGCTTTANGLLNNPAAPVLTVSPTDTSVTLGSAVQLNAVLTNYNATSYNWDNGSVLQNPVITADDLLHVYHVEVGYGNGCKVSGQATVRAESNNHYYIPTAFTPNGDTKNDLFNVYVTNYKTFSLSIYNRWGEKVYEGNIPEDANNRQQINGWDGKFKNELQPNEVYVYFMQLVFLDGKVANEKGSLTLIR